MSMAASKTVILVDGENLVFRYQDMVGNGATPKSNVIHERDVYVWSPDIIRATNDQVADILRISYYTCAVGAPEQIQSLHQSLGNIEYRFTSGVTGGGGGGRHNSGGPIYISDIGTLNPRIFKKGRQDNSSKQIDVAIVLDALNYSLLENIEAIQIFSGDADYIPVINEIMRRGKKVEVKSFSSGIRDELKIIPDNYECIDSCFFENTPTG